MSPLRAAVLGCGPRGRQHAEVLSQLDGVELVAVADREAAAAQALAAALAVRARSGLHDLLGGEAPELLVVATPPRGRSELVEGAAASGRVRGILVEKPLALSLSEARRMVDSCERAGVLLTVGHQLRFAPEFVALAQAVESGELGELEMIRAVGFGNLLDQGPHLLDAVSWLSGGRGARWAMAQRGDAAAALLPADALPPAGETHPAPAWMTSYLCLEGDLRAVVETGALYQRSSGRFVDDWLQQRVVVLGSDGVGEAQAASHAEVRGPGGRRSLVEGGLETLALATRGFHEELRDALRDGGVHRSTARAALPGFETLVACAQSAVDGDAAVLPLDEGRDPLAELARPRPAAASRGVAPKAEAALEVSVIVPLPDHRGFAADCIRSWASEQTLERSRFELIVVSDGSEPAVERQVEELLGPGDRLLRVGERHELALYDAAARAASARLLLFTEPHCIAEPACLDELLRFVEGGRWDGACLRSTGINGNALARMEERLFEAGFREWSQAGHWCKVILRGFALRREVYLAEGGFDTAYDRFAEFVLAATLHRRGHRIGYARGACVQHAYTTSFRDFAPPTRDFVRGECRYRAEQPAELWRPYFGRPPRWSDDVATAHGLARTAWASAARGLPRRSVWRAPTAARAAARTVTRLVPSAAAGARGALFLARLREAAARARCTALRPLPGLLYPAYVDVWSRIVDTATLEWLAAEAPAMPRLAPLGRASIRDIPDGRAFGLHEPDDPQGEDFRWTQAVAVLQLPFPKGAKELRLETAPIRPPDAPLCLWAFVNGRRLPPRAVSVEPERITLRLDRARLRRGGEQRVALTCAPLERRRQDPTDARELGIPLAGVEVA